MYSDCDGKSGDSQAVVEAILNLVKNHAKMEKKARLYGTDVQIHKSEIKMISTIAAHPGIHIGGLADYFGFTKGAVSEAIRKLEKKGLVRKKVDSRNLSRLLIYLTAKGEIAHQEHIKQYLAVEKISEELFKDTPEEHIKAIRKFLNQLSKRLVELEHSI